MVEKVHKCEVYSRVVGFYTPVQQWNNGKAEEYKKRKVFSFEDALKGTKQEDLSVK